MTKISVEVSLQSILDHTTNRLIRQQENVTSELSRSNLTLISRLVCADSSGHSTYKQKLNKFVNVCII